MLPSLFGKHVSVKFCAFLNKLKLKYNVEYLQIFTMNSKKKTLVFMRTQLLNESSWEVPVGQVLKMFEFASKPEQPGLPSLICLQVICVRKQVFGSTIINENRC